MQFAGCKIFFFDAGTYLVSDTLEIPAGVQIFGEAWAVIAGTGSKFNDIDNPKVVVRVGAVGSQGIAEIGGMIFSTRGPSECLPPPSQPLSCNAYAIRIDSRWRHHP